MEIETPQAGADSNPADGQEPEAQDDKTVSELERARKEAAKYRTRAQAAEKQLKDAEPVLAEYQKQQEAQKTEAQKAAERASAAEAKAQEAEAKAERLAKEKQLLRLATRANVDPDLLDFLDLDKLDLSDEAKTLAVLGKLATAKAGGASNPGRGTAPLSDDEIRAEVYGQRRKSSIFGG
jgi:chromosome segregation ATPase